VGKPTGRAARRIWWLTILARVDMGHFLQKKHGKQREYAANDKFEFMP
jgi:hypothetical protein